MIINMLMILVLFQNILVRTHIGAICMSGKNLYCQKNFVILDYQEDEMQLEKSTNF